MPLEDLLRIGAVRRIWRWGTAVLHSTARPVTDFGPDLQRLVADLFATNRAAGGAGLAAPQIGVDLAVFVYDCRDASSKENVGLVCNPVVDTPTGRDRRLDIDAEGCLSLPGAYIETPRPDFAICTGQDQYGSPIEVVGTGVLARCLQHETDHCNGIVFADRLSRRSRDRLWSLHREVEHRYGPEWPIPADR
jgi:peptide deformylase